MRNGRPYPSSEGSGSLRDANLSHSLHARWTAHGQFHERIEENNGFAAPANSHQIKREDDTQHLRRSEVNGGSTNQNTHHELRSASSMIPRTSLHKRSYSGSSTSSEDERRQAVARQQAWRGASPQTQGVSSMAASSSLPLQRISNPLRNGRDAQRPGDSKVDEDAANGGSHENGSGSETVRSPVCVGSTMFVGAPILAKCPDTDSLHCVGGRISCASFSCCRQRLAGKPRVSSEMVHARG